MPARTRLGCFRLASVLALAICGCAGQPQTSPVLTSAPPAQPLDGQSVRPGRTPQEPTQSASVAPPTVEGPSYDNPVFSSDFPDPHVVRVDGTYYAYSTNSANQNVPVISSEDLATWARERDGMPGLPSWTGLNFGTRWAPGVIQIGETFVLYFVACDANYRPPSYQGQVCVLPVDATERQCIGVATADNPAGPFVDDRAKPFICQYDLGGSIDPYPFRDQDDQLYLYWKNDGNCCGKPVGLWVQALSDDGLKLTGEPVELIQRDQPWEIPLIENPAMVEHEGAYYLFYSGNRWDTHEYAVGYAVCESATGPCEKPLDRPIFKFTQQVFGPGGEAFFNDKDGNLIMAYHAWPAPKVGYPQGQRMLFIDPVTFDENGMPVVTGPTSDPQPLP
jgi:beta-xylosidase